MLQGNPYGFILDITIIVSGNIKGVILQHAPFREFYDTMEKLGCRIPDIVNDFQTLRQKRGSTHRYAPYRKMPLANKQNQMGEYRPARCLLLITCAFVP